MEQLAETKQAASTDLLSVILADDWSISLHVSTLPVIILFSLIVLAWLILRIYSGIKLSAFEIDSAEIGLGDHKISFRPNDMDRQIAYSIWVELSTRKIGLPIDATDDVIVEIYDSWYAFFAVTRELIKDIPVSKARGSSTSKIIDLSVEVLNEGLRPHLTKWQARFRHWYERQLENKTDVDPQNLQKNFPAYAELMEDLLSVNKRLISYRTKMYQLARS